MWCLVNRKARIVIFFYEDTTDDEGVRKHGGRGRNVLKEFLGDVHIPADTRSAFPVISVHSQVSIQCRWQS